MATQFIATVMPSGGDYTSLSTSIDDLQNDITAADIKVFSISAYSTPTIAAGDTVLGQSSLATGVCVLVNAARTQILIKTIAVASFLSGEIVQKTADANVNVRLSDNGDSPIIIIKIDGTWISADPDGDVNISYTYWTTSATNYLKIYTTSSARHIGKWNTGKYILTTETTNATITIDVSNIQIDGLQIESSTGTEYGNGILNDYADNVKVSNCIIRNGNNTGTNKYGIKINADGNLTMYIWNTIIYGFANTSDSGIRADLSGTNYIYIYNTTLTNNMDGINDTYQDVIAKNVLSYNNTTDFSGTFNPTCNYNFSKDDSAPGVNSIHGDTDGKTPDFINGTAGSEDLHIQRTSDARNSGTDNPGAGLYLDDIDGDTRSSPWDIGAVEFINRHTRAYIF